MRKGQGSFGIVLRHSHANIAQCLLLALPFWQLLHPGERRVRIVLRPRHGDRVNGIALGLSAWQLIHPSHCRGRIGLRPLTGDLADKVIPRVAGGQRVGKIGGRLWIVLRHLPGNVLQRILFGSSFGQRLDPIQRGLDVAVIGETARDLAVDVHLTAAATDQGRKFRSGHWVLICQRTDDVLQQPVAIRAGRQGLDISHRVGRILLRPGSDRGAEGIAFVLPIRQAIGPG